MTGLQSRTIEERAYNELQHWISRCGEIVPENVRDQPESLARDIGVAFALGYVDAIGFGLIGQTDASGRTPLVALSRLRLVVQEYPDIEPPSSDEVSPNSPDVRGFGMWMRPTARGQAADVNYFLTLLRASWRRQDFNDRVHTTRRLVPLELIALDDRMALLREGYGDVRVTG